MELASEHITAGILAGGAGRRLGGIDKGWYVFDGQPLIEHTLARVAPQCGHVVISANRSLARYRELGHHVCRDDSGDNAGPLAGIAAILRAAVTPYVLIVPVDTPALPLDLAARLAAPMHASSPLATARCAARRQPLHALLRRDVLGTLESALVAGVRAVHEWQDRLDHVSVAWPDCKPFTNINSDDDARALGDRR